MSWLTKLFKRTSKILSNSEKNRIEGCNAFNEGYRLYENNFFEKALPFFDIAIKYEHDLKHTSMNFYERRAAGWYNLDDAYKYRAYCLQALEFHLDAIDDFSKTIELTPDDCNLYFSRSMSKMSMYDCEGQVSDLEKAIELSKINNELNQEYLLNAKEMGRDSHTLIYQMQLYAVKPRLETNLYNELRDHSKATKNIYKRRFEKNL